MANRRTPPRSRFSGGSAAVGLGIAVGVINGVAVGPGVAVGVGAGVEVAGTTVGFGFSPEHCNDARAITSSIPMSRNLLDNNLIEILETIVVFAVDSVG